MRPLGLLELELEPIDPCRRGLHSHALPGLLRHGKIGHPFEQRLFFAGEATHAHDCSTANGAHDSGVRAADEAITALTSVASLNATKSGSSGSS